MLIIRQNRYNLMDSYHVKGDSIEYPDCLSINLDDYVETRPSEEVVLTSFNVARPDIFFFSKMGTNNLEDIVLWLNHLPSRRNLTAGQIIKLPFLGDLNKFYLNNRKVN